MSKDESGREAEILTVDGHEVRISHPDKPYFTLAAKLSKLDIVRYFLAVAPGALAGIRDRPIVLKRFLDGAESEPFYQKRAPPKLPPFLRTATLAFPSGRTAEEVVVDDAAGLAFVVNLGCIELHPHPVRSGDLDHPDELRIDLDPVPGVGWDDIRRVAMEVKALMEELGLTGWPKTSGSRGLHVNARIFPRWTFVEVRRAALAFSREIERRAPTLATSKWWKEERHGVFLDYNQNAKDRTTCSAYSVRPLPDARVSTPLAWSEVPDCEPADFTVATVPARFATIGDPQAAMDSAPGSLEPLLELAARQEAAGLPDAPWPPQYRKMEGEAPRVAPSKAKRPRASKEATAGPAGKAATEASLDGAIFPETAGSGAVDSSTVAEGGPSAASATGSDPDAASRGRRSRMPLITIANAQDKVAALAGLERWRARHAEAAARLAPDDILVDGMRGAYKQWFRIRINLRHVPENQRPPQEPPDPDDDPTRGWREAMKAGAEAFRAVTPENMLPAGLSRPALRALAVAGIVGLEEAAAHSEAEVAALHGVGPKAIIQLRAALAASGRTFRDG